MITENLSVSEIASMFGMQESDVRARIAGRGAPQAFFSIQELAERWRCSRGTVRNRLRGSGAKVLDFASPGQRGKKAVPTGVVLQIENRKTKLL